MPRTVCGSARPTSAPPSTAKRAPRPASRVDAEASAWIARLDAREPSRRVRALFERWRAASPRHEAAYRRLAAVWSRLDGLGALGTTPVSPLKRS